MESSEVPFIAEYDPYSKTRPLKQWRPRSTQPWTISLFLAATGICFGLLLAISLMDKERPKTITKRDIYDNDHGVRGQRDLFKRQQSTCTDLTTATVTICSPLASNYACPSTTTEPVAATIDTCAVTFTLVTPGYLVSTTKDLASSTSPTITQETVSSALYPGFPTSQVTTSKETSQTTSDSSSTALQETITVIPLFEMTLTATMTAMMTMITTTMETMTESVYVFPVSLATSSSQSVTLSTMTITSTYVSQPEQSSTSSNTEIVYGSSNSEPSSSTSRKTESGSSESSSQPSTTPEFTSSALTSSAVAPFPNPTTQDSQSTSPLVLAPLTNPTAQTTSVTELPSSTQTPLSSLSEQTTVTVTVTAGITTHSLLTPTHGITSSTQPTSTSVHSALNQNLVLIKMSNFHDYYYFLALYLPKIIAVTMTTLWTTIFAGLKLVEPFYQLSANTGALASQTMFGNYLASEISSSSLSATFSGQWVLVLGGTVLMMWAAIVALISECMIIVVQGQCADPDGRSYRCDPGWAVNEPILTVLLVLTGFAFVLILILILILSRRKRTGLYHDPSSIAAMAEFLGNPMVMEDLQAIKPSSNDHEVELMLGENRYRIGLYDPSTGKDASSSLSNQHELRWGLIKLDYTPLTQKIANGRLVEYSAVANPSIVSAEELKANRKRRLFQVVFDTIMLLTALCVFAMVLGYWLDDKIDSFNNFFNSETFGPRFVLTSLCLILSIGWRRMSRQMTVMAPYRAMARAYEVQSGVAASRSILAPTAHTPWTALYKGLRNRNHMVTVVAICAVLADLLLIAVAGVPYRQGPGMVILKTSAFASLSILGITILALIAVIVYSRTSAGGTRKLPRSPNTLLGVWLYLCHGRLADQRVDRLDGFSSPLDANELIAKYANYQYGFTCKIGPDNVRRWTIDTVIDLRTWTLPMTHPHQQHENHQRPVIDTVQAPQSFEAREIPVEGPLGYQTRQEPFIYRTASRKRSYTSPYSIPYFEAQAKNPVTQAPPARFEDLRPRPQPRSEPQPQPKSQPLPRPPVVQLTPRPKSPPVRPQEPVPTMHEALMQWEYEQEFHNPRRMSAGSMYTEARWTNDSRSQYRYG